MIKNLRSLLRQTAPAVLGGLVSFLLLAAVPAATLMFAAASAGEARAANEYGREYDTPEPKPYKPTGWVPGGQPGTGKKMCYVVKGTGPGGSEYMYGPYKCIEDAKPVKTWCLERGLTGVNIVERVVG